MAKLSESELDLRDKLDLARTIRRLQARVDTRRDLNELEDAIRKAHEEQVNERKPTAVNLESLGRAIYDGLALEDGE